MATLRPTLANGGYKNWVKGGLALKFAKEGIENFVERNIDTFHQDILNRLSTGIHCYSCSTENIIQCRYNNNLCKFSKNICQVHDSKDPTKKCRPCPDSVCNVIRDEILNQHRFRGPSWKNSDSRLWCREPWQLATCYMSNGYSAAVSASDTDFTGLVSVIINNKIFETEVTDNLTNKNNLFCQARAARNDILHKANTSLTDAELVDYITTLDTMLADSKCLAVNPCAIQARKLLEQLLNGTLNVTTGDEAEVLAEALRTINDKTTKAREEIKSGKDDALTAISKEKDIARDEIKSDKNEAVTAIKKAKHKAREKRKSDNSKAVTAIKKAKYSARDKIKANKDNALKSIKTEKAKAVITITSKREEAVTKINTKETITIAALQDALNEAKRFIKEKEEEPVTNLKDIGTEKLKKGLKAELLSVYQDGEHLTTPLSLLDPSEDKHIEQLYVTPNMKLVDHRKEQKGEGKYIETYKDIFKDENKKIYVVGEAGTGKTAFCQEMVYTWCQVQTRTIVDMSDNQKAMSNFDFLFYISLRDAITHSCIAEMIKHLLLPNKPGLQRQLAKVIEEERCLVVLDGLDEWTTETKTASSSHVNKGIPGRDNVRNCTMITTTRPWKLEVLQLKASQIETKVKLLGIDLRSSEQLSINMITHLNEIYNTQKRYQDFVSELERKNIIDLRTIPVVLKQIICLWHSGKELGQTKSVIYCQMLELLFELAQPRLEKDSQYQQEKHEWMKSSLKLPSCLDDHESCKLSKHLLYVLSKLAFQTLFSDDQESSLVFKSTKEGCYHLSPAEVKICLKIGILCQDKLLKNSVSPFKKISFLHKNFQEFLAAMFVSLNQSETIQCVEKLQQFWSTEEKCLGMLSVLTFISGLCPSDITCTLLDHYKSKGAMHRQPILIDCMREGWTCSHENKHLYCDHIVIEELSENLNQLCKANISNTEILSLHSPPTAECLQHLLQIHTLKNLYITSASDSPISQTPLYELEICTSQSPTISEDLRYDWEISSSDSRPISEDLRYDLGLSNISDSLPISEDLLYDLVHNNRHTLTYIYINGMTLRSNTRLSTLLHQVEDLKALDVVRTTLPIQLLSSLQALDSTLDYLCIDNFTILPDTESTE